MLAELTRAGPLLYAVLAILGGWGLYVLMHGALALGRRRLPAPLFWLFPALALGVAGGGALLGQGVAEQAVAALGAGDAVRARAMGYADAARLVWAGAAAVTLVLALSGPWLALTSVARGGEKVKWTAVHALPAGLGLVGAFLGLLSGPLAFGLGLVGTFAIAVSALRLGTRADRKRMAASRGLVGAVGVTSAVALALTHLVGVAIERLEVAARAPYEAREAALRALEDGLPWLVAGDVAVAGGLLLATLGVVAPVARSLLDGRTSGGLLFSVFLAVIPAATVTPAVLPLFQLPVPDELRDRVASMTRLGIELVDVDAEAPWSPGIAVTVGVYWVHVDNTRVLPFKDGRVEASAMDGPMARPVFEAINGTSGGVRLEVDRRVDLVRLAPVLEAVRRAGHEEVCFVVRDRAGHPGCQMANLATPRQETAQILLRSMDITLVTAEGEPEILELAGSGERLGALPRPLVLHPDREVSATRLVTALKDVNAVSDPPKLALE